MDSSTYLEHDHVAARQLLNWGRSTVDLTNIGSRVRDCWRQVVSRAPRRRLHA